MLGVNLGLYVWIGKGDAILKRILYPQEQSQSSLFLLKSGYCAVAAENMWMPDNSFIWLNQAYNAGQPTQIIASEISGYPVSTTKHAAKTEEATFKSKLRVLAGLMYVQKNSKDGVVKIKSGYLEIPVYVSYYHLLKNDGAVFGGVGPYIAYGIGGKNKGNNFSEKTFDKDFGFKRFDAGISLTAGYRLPMGLSFRFAYDLGLADIDRIDVDHTKNRSFSFNIGYPISKMLKK